MENKKIYIAIGISVIVIIILVLVLLLVFRCGAGFAGNIEKEDVSETEIAEETEAEETTEEEEGETSEEDGEEAPTIKLEIYDGPTYVPDGDICYYRIKAVVTGEPEPDIVFSKDDSGGAWGKDRCQVNIHRGETYTLKATAKNSKGEDTDTIDLSWGCGSENRNPVISEIIISEADIYTGEKYDISVTASDPDGDSLKYEWSATSGTVDNTNNNPTKWTAPGAAGNLTIKVKVTDGKGGEGTESKNITVKNPLLMEIPRVAAEGGYIEEGGYINNGGCLFAGDSPANKLVRGFISFDISSLSGAKIKTAEISFNKKEVWNPPVTFGNLNVISVYWGTRALIASDFSQPGTYVCENAAPDFTFSGDALKNAIQARIDDGKSRVQFILMFVMMGSDGFNNWTGYEYFQEQINLRVIYIP